MEKVMLMPNCSAIWTWVRVRGRLRRGGDVGTNLGQVLLHDLGAVVDGENDIGHAGFGQSLDLVHDHWPVAELNQRLGQSKGLGRGPSRSTEDLPRCGEAERST